MKLGCVIMASGEGKRFGSNKMLADICGKPLIQRTIESVPKGFDVVVTTRWPQVAEICCELRCACALHDGALRSESVRAGLTWGADRGWKGCLFLPGDQPLVSSDSFEALAGAFKANGGVAPVRLALNGEPASPVLFPASLFPDLMGSLRARMADRRCCAAAPMSSWSRHVPTSCGMSTPPRASAASRSISRPATRLASRKDARVAPAT